MAKGNDTRRKITTALRAASELEVTAQTLSELRKLLGLTGVNTLDLTKNLLAMNGSGELSVCALTAPNIRVVLAA